jgi:hypothetical protein
MGESRKMYKVLVGKPEGKRQLGRLRHSWQDGIRMDLTEIGWGGGGRVDPFGSGYRLIAGSCRYIDEPSGSDSMEVVTLSY